MLVLPYRAVLTKVFSHVSTLEPQDVDASPASYTTMSTQGSRKQNVYIFLVFAELQEPGIPRLSIPGEHWDTVYEYIYMNYGSAESG